MSNLPANVIENRDAAAETLAHGRAMQQVRASYATAVSVQKPRQLADVQRRFLEEANMAGEDFYYGWGVGKNAITGASVDLALSAARCWGNCAVESLPIQDEGDAWIFPAVFIDLETGFTLSRNFRQSKGYTVHGQMDEFRKDDIRFQIGQSKSIRNVILNALPPSLVARGMKAAMNGVREKIEKFVKEKGLPAAVDHILRALAKVGVKEGMVLAKCGVGGIAALDLDHIVVLRSDLSALEAGRERVETLYPTNGVDDATAKTEAALAGAQAKQRAQAKPPPAETKPPIAETPPAPERQPGEDDAPPDQDEMQRNDLIESLLERIANLSSVKAGEDIGTDLVRNREFLGEENYAQVLLKLQEKQRVLVPPAKAPGEKKGRMF